MKLTKETLQKLIEEELQNSGMIDEGAFMDKLKGVFGKKKPSFQVGSDDAAEEGYADIETGEWHSAADAIKDLRTTTSSDLAKIAPNEFPEIGETFHRLVDYAKQGNAAGGNIKRILDMLNKAIDDAIGEQPSGEEGEEGAEKAGGGEPLPQEHQDTIVAALEFLKNMGANTTPQHAENAKTAILQALNNAGAIDTAKLAESKRFFYTLINLLNERKTVTLNESLTKFVKSSMRKELLTEAAYGVDMPGIQRGLADTSPGAASASKTPTSGLAGGQKNYMSSQSSTKTPTRKDALSGDVGRKVMGLINQIAGPNAVEPEALSGITDELFGLLRSIGYLGGSAWANRGKEAKAQSKWAQATKQAPKTPPPSDNIPTNVARTDDLTLERQNVFTMIHQLSEQKALKLNDKQKKIVRTMMLAETQLLAERKLLK